MLQTHVRICPGCARGFIGDLRVTNELDGLSMIMVCGGWLGGVLSAIAIHPASGSGGTKPSPGLSDITITKTTDTPSNTLF